MRKLLQTSVITLTFGVGFVGCAGMNPAQKGAAGGAAIGGGVGALTGGTSDALVGAGVGALGGALLGHEIGDD